MSTAIYAVFVGRIRNEMTLRSWQDDKTHLLTLCKEINRGENDIFTRNQLVYVHS